MLFTRLFYKLFVTPFHIEGQKGHLNGLLRALDLARYTINIILACIDFHW